jgi:chemotaxis signal transduction protein
VLLFSAGGARLALRLPLVREVVQMPTSGPELEVRGNPLVAMPLALALGLTPGAGRFAIVTPATPPMALRIDEVHGITDLAEAEVFQLPTRTVLPQPAPFQGAVVQAGRVWLELALTAAGWVPLEPASGEWDRPPEVDLASGRELVFVRAGHRFAVPLSLLVRVIERPQVAPVPLTPPAHRGLLYHERAIHPVFDLAAVYDGAPAPGRDLALLVDAGGTAAALLADRVATAAEEGEVIRPAWDALFPA